MTAKHSATDSKPAKSESTADTPQEVCGLVMPISGCDGCTDKHWVDVREILESAVAAVGFLPKLVSTADEVGIIQARIIENLYDNPVVVCDVSGKNPNVMFELGLRLAFDKPTVIIKDDHTGYSFDTAPIEHLTYPRDLHYQSIQQFTRTLGEKVRSTREAAKRDSTHSSFLKHFGRVTLASLDKHQVGEMEYVRRSIEGLQATCSQLTHLVAGLSTKRWSPEDQESPTSAIRMYRDLRTTGRSKDACVQDLVRMGFAPADITRAVRLDEEMPPVKIYDWHAQAAPKSTSEVR